MFLAAIPLTDAQRQMLRDTVHTSFGVLVDVEGLLPLDPGNEGGANSASHFAIKTTAPHRYFGLKRANRIANGDTNERLIADICRCIDAPNTCHVAHIGPVPFVPALAAGDVSLCAWLPDSKKLKDIDAARKTSLGVMTGPGSFYEQLGELITFGLFFGIADRHRGNWVISAADRIAMIDLEEGFTPPNIANFGWWPDYLDRARARAEREGYQPVAELARGCGLMVDKFARHRFAIEVMLAGQSYTANYSSPYWDSDKSRIVDELLRVL